jgi:hypothetical protein
MKMKRFWDKRDGDDIEARLRHERPAPSLELIDRISGEIATAPSTSRTITRTRKGVAIAFASLVLASTFGAAAFAAAGGNGGGSMGNGNGGGGVPAGCVEGRGQVLLQNPNC